MNYDLLKEVVWQLSDIAQAVVIILIIFKIFKMEKQIEKVRPLKKSNENTYKKKARDFEAWKFTKEALDKEDSWLREYRADLSLISQYGGEVLYVNIETPEKDIRVDLGDYIIKDADGKFHVCDKEIFDETYEIAE